MLFMFLLSLVSANQLEMLLKPKENYEFVAILEQNDVELSIRLTKFSPGTVKYRIVLPGMTPTSENIFELESSFNQKYTEKGEYKIEAVNTSGEDVHFSVYTYVQQKDNTDKDTESIRRLFSDLENKLISLYNTNMTLKNVQEKNILEARRIRTGLMVLFFIPVLYAVIGAAKYKLMVTLFTPKRGIKP